MDGCTRECFKFLLTSLVYFQHLRVDQRVRLSDVMQGAADTAGIVSVGDLTGFSYAATCELDGDDEDWRQLGKGLMYNIWQILK